ncbi:MAG TPA: hypothetical protein VIX89_04540 [Bryobacteraceae bacterium]
MGVTWRTVLVLSAAAWGALGQTGADVPADAIAIKIVPARTFLVHRQAIKSLDETGPIEFTVVPRIKRKLKSLGYDPIPPIEVHVFFEGDDIQELETARYAARQFEVAAAIDKAPEEDLGQFTTKQSGAYRCLSLVFKGSPLESSKYWATLYDAAKARKLTAASENREIALSREGYDPGKYTTELQLGIK